MLRIALFVLSSVLAASYGLPQELLAGLPKCALKDQECLRKVYVHVVHSIIKEGIPEFGIPPLDPMKLNNVTVSVLDVLDITLVKGVATGVRTCVFDKFTMDLAKGSGYQENTCSMNIEGKYNLKSTGQPVENIFGSGPIHGDGNAKVSIDNLHLKFDWPIYVKKGSDGEIYLKCDNKRIIYEYQVMGGAKFAADNIYVGDKEVSKAVVPFLNENWKFVMSTFGKAFIDKSMKFYFDFAGKFFDVVPVKYFIKDDLTPFVRP